MAKAKAASASVYSTVLNTKADAPQTQAISGREAEMATNNAGGVTFTVTPWTNLERFLILGSDKPTYYVSAQKLTKDNAANVRECLKLDGRKTVDMIVGFDASVPSVIADFVRGTSGTSVEEETED
jgi:60 kDa SS-A/Ro ribonucleoprotein